MMKWQCNALQDLIGQTHQAEDLKCSLNYHLSECHRKRGHAPSLAEEEASPVEEASLVEEEALQGEHGDCHQSQLPRPTLENW